LRGSDGVGVCRAKLAASGLSNRLAVVHQVRRGLTMERLVDDGGQFINHPSSSLSLIGVMTRDALIIILPIISIGKLVRWYRLIVVCTIGKYKLLFLLQEVNKHDSGFRFR